MTKDKQMNILSKALGFWMHRYQENENNKLTDGIDGEYMFKKVFIASARVKVYSKSKRVLNEDDQKIVKKNALIYMKHIKQNGYKCFDLV